jgi:hypothetical protein
LSWSQTVGSPLYNPDVDFDGDGAVNFADFSRMLQLWGGTPGPSGLAP